MSGNPIQSWILDSTLSIADSGYWIPDSLSAELVFWIPAVSGILDFLSWITDLKAEHSGLRNPQANISCDCGFHKQKFPGIRIPQAKISWILDSTSKNFLDSGFHKQKFPGFWIPPAKISRILDSTSQNFPYSEFHKQKFPGFWNPDYLTWGDIKIWLVFSFAFSFCPREIDDPSEKVAYLVEDSRKSSVPVRSDHTDSKGPTSVWEWNWNARTNGPETLVHRIIV